MLEVTDLIYNLDYGFVCYRDTSGKASHEDIPSAYYRFLIQVRITKHTEKMFTIVLSQFISPIRYISFNDIFVCYLDVLTSVYTVAGSWLLHCLAEGVFFLVIC